MYEEMKQRDKDFAKALSTYVNCFGFSGKAVAQECKNHHRYLQNEEFTLVLEILKAFAEEYDDKMYDDRNEYACKASKLLINYLISDKFDKEDYPKLT